MSEAEVPSSSAPPPHDGLLKQAARHHQAGNLDQAQRQYEQILAADPKHADALCNLTALHFQRGAYPLAAVAAERALKVRPADPNQWHFLGRALEEQRRYPQAHEAYRAALRHDRGHAGAWFSLGMILVRAGEQKSALRALKQCRKLRPDHAEALDQYVHQSQQIAAWTDLDGPVQALRRAVASPAHIIPPFSLYFLCKDPAELLRAARKISARIEQLVAPDLIGEPPRPEQRRAGRIRVAYLSADFRAHPMARLIANLFAAHDRARFEVFAYSYGVNDGDPLRQRIAAGVEHFVDVLEESATDIARRIREDQIDVLIDLMGYTQFARPQIVALRPAPVQMHWMGCPGTMGANFVDYMVADQYVIPPDARKHYSEKGLFMPVSYFLNGASQADPSPLPDRRSAGLPASGTVYACFNQIAKITPPVFDLWMEVLRRKPGSVLWLLAYNRFGEANLRQEAVRRGVEPERLIFAPIRESGAHLARYRLVDLALDPFPYNGHTTTSDALLMGCPVLTLVGSTFASRVAGSLLSAAGLDEMIAQTPALYVEKALAFGNSQAPLRTRIDAQLGELSSTHPLFNSQRFAADLERGIQAAFERWMQGLPADDITLEAGQGTRPGV